MNESTEIVVCDAPFTVRRIARWIDCDPAGAVFTGRFTDYLLGAVMHFLHHIGYGVGGREWKAHGIGLPCKHMSLTFHASLYPEDRVDIRLHVGDIRTRTFDVIASARHGNGTLAFTGQFTPIVIHADTRESIEIPPALREKLQLHQRQEEIA